MCKEKLGQQEKEEQLRQILREYTKKDCCLAFSGGIDSSLILKLGSRYAKEQGTRLYAVTFETELHPKADARIARQVAAECGAEFVLLSIDETTNPQILDNPPQRCYYCKKYLFETLIDWAAQRNIHTIMEGTNADDLKVYRPGIQAVRELGVKSPLLEAGLSKAEIRAIAESLKLSVAHRPSQPCMATRIPYHTKLDFSVLHKLEEGENYLRGLGFSVVRLRLHGDILRIEVMREAFPLFFEQQDVIVETMKELGFVYVTLDLEGFRSGSMDVHVAGE